MAQQPGKYLSIFIPQPLFDKIETYWHRERLTSRVETIRVLIRRGLECKCAAKKENGNA